MISLILLYYRNPYMLRKQLYTWKGYPKELRDRLEFVVIDDGSPIEEAKVGKCNLNLSIYKVLKNIPFNFTGARNLGATVAKEDWLLFCDIDYLLDTENMQLMTELTGDPKKFYCFRANSVRKGRHHARYPKTSILVNKAEYWAVDGNDEDFAGHYGKEGYTVPFKLEKNGLTFVKLDSPHYQQFMGTEVDYVKGEKWSKDRTRNVDLYNDKLSGKAPWSKDKLRFEWKKTWPITS